jgi:hypothetical protein
VTGLASETRAFRAALVNGLLVFVLPLTLLLVAYVNAFHRPWPPEVIVEGVKFGLVFATLAAIAAWRTWVHATRYLARRSRGWQGVAEATACGLMVAVPNLAPAVLALDPAAPRVVIFYGGLAAVVGCLVGVLLRATALAVLKPLQPPGGAARCRADLK